MSAKQVLLYSLTIHVKIEREYIGVCADKEFVNCCCTNLLW